MLLPACTGREKAADATADSAVASRTLVGTARPDSARVPGALAKPLPEYTADEFRALAESLTFSGGADQQRTCRKTAGCEAKGGTLTAARVDAAPGLDSLRGAQLTANGVIAARVRVTGQYEEARYGMRPGAFVYYVVLYPDTGGTVSWRLAEVATGAGGEKVTAIGTGPFRPCPPSTRRQSKYRANFWSCTAAHDNDSTLTMGLTQHGALSDPMWLTCPMGCCTVS